MRLIGIDYLKKSVNSKVSSKFIHCPFWSLKSFFLAVFVAFIFLFGALNGSAQQLTTSVKITNTKCKASYYCSNSDKTSTGFAFTNNGAIKSMVQDSSPVKTRLSSGVSVLGPAQTDFNANGIVDLVLLLNENTIQLWDKLDSLHTTIDISNQPAKTSKTKLAVGSWDGSGPSVFYAHKNNSELYRVSPGNGPTKVTQSGNGIHALAGIGDIDGDHAQELVFADGSQEIRYVDDNQKTKTTGTTAGSNNGIGVGNPYDFNGNGKASIPIVNGSNEIVLLGPNGNKANLLNGSSKNALKAPISCVDVDCDPGFEIVFQKSGSPYQGKATYVDDVRGTNKTTYINDNIDDKVEAQNIIYMGLSNASSCNGQVDLSVSGGTPPYSYTWSNGVTNQDIKGLCAGNYTVTITDNSGASDTVSVSVSEPSIVHPSIDNKSNVSSHGGSDGAIDVSVSGGTPGYGYDWSNDSTSEDLTNLSAGTYTVTVTDSNGCNGIAATTITQPCQSISSGSWSDGSNWTSNCSGTGGIPGLQDRVVITDGHQVTVSANQSVKSIRLIGDDSSATNLTLENSSQLSINDSFRVASSCNNNPVSLDLDGSSHLDIGGDMLVDNNGGDGMKIELNANSGNDAKLSVAGNIDFDLASGCADKIQLYAHERNDSIDIEGSMILDNENNKSSKTIAIAMQSSSVLAIEDNLDFHSSSDENTFVKLNNSSQLQIGGDITRQSSPNRFGSIMTNKRATIVADGANQQQLAGNAGDANDSITYSNLTINNSSDSFPQVTLGGNVTVTNKLALKAGNIKTANDTLSLTNTSASSLTAYSAQSHIVGYFKRHIAKNNSEYVFPLGEGTDSTYYQGAIVNHHMSDVSYIVGKFAPSLTRYDSSKLKADAGEFEFNYLCNDGMWIFEPDQQPTSGMYDTKLWIENLGGLTDNLFGIVKRPKGGMPSAWSKGDCMLSSPGGKGRLLEDGYAMARLCRSFSEKTVGGGDGTSQPINLINFDAELNKNQVDLNWTTVSEVNNDYFTVERSVNGYEWEEIAKVDGAGNSSYRINYEENDEKPYEGISYYRLKQTDLNGEATHTGVITINNKGYEASEIQVYPNPTSGRFQIELMSSANSLKMTLFNINGESIFKKRLGSTDGLYKRSFNFHSKPSSGVYFLRIKPANSDQSYTEKIRIQK